MVTKESAAVTFTPFLVLGAAVPLSRRLTRSSGRAILTVAVLMALVIGGLALLLVMAPDALASNPLLQKTFGAGPLILASVRNAIPRIPAYSEQLTRIFGLRELGLGVLCAALVGYVWLLTQTVVALVSGRRLLSLWVLGWLAAAIVWAFGITLPARSLAALGQSDPWVAVAAGGLLAGIGTVGLRMRSAHPNGWGLALLGLVVLVVLAERLIIVVTPNVSAAALFFRSLMPIVPLYAILAAGGVWAAANAVSLLVPSVRWARPALTILAGVAVVTFWSPLLRERLSSQPLLGRVADRGADAETPQGLRVEALVEAEPWLQANLEPTDLDHHRHSAPPGLVCRPGWRRAWDADRSQLAATDRRAAATVHPRSSWTARGVVRRRLQRQLARSRRRSRRASGVRPTRRWPVEPTWSPPTCAATDSATRSSTSSATTATPSRRPASAYSSWIVSPGP